jgi:hypothetical protein
VTVVVWIPPTPFVLYSWWRYAVAVGLLECDWLVNLVKCHIDFNFTFIDKLIDKFCFK